MVTEMDFNVFLNIWRFKYYCILLLIIVLNPLQLLLCKSFLRIYDSPIDYFSILKPFFWKTKKDTFQVFFLNYFKFDFQRAEGENVTVDETPAEEIYEEDFAEPEPEPVADAVEGDAEEVAAADGAQEEANEESLVADEGEPGEGQQADDGFAA